ncbi:MAG: hypothetical protein Q7R67_02675 [bacterium]|nr:hypothetical protein [bacterium]
MVQAVLGRKGVTMARRERRNREEQYYHEAIEACQKGWLELLSGADEPESPRLYFWTDESGETVHIRDADGNRGNMPVFEFEWVKEFTGEACLLCFGPLGLIFDPESKPPLYLVCDRCEAHHRPVLSGLCLWVR